MELGLSRSGIIEGVVLSPEGEPLDMAHVYTGERDLRSGPSPGNAAAFTDAEGRFRIDSLSAGESQLTGYGLGYQAATIPIVNSPGSTTQVEIMLGYRGGVEGVVSFGGRGWQVQLSTCVTKMPRKR